MTDKVAGVENAGQENDGQICRGGKCRTPPEISLSVIFLSCKFSAPNLGLKFCCTDKFLSVSDYELFKNMNVLDVTKELVCINFRFGNIS